MRKTSIFALLFALLLLCSILFIGCDSTDSGNESTSKQETTTTVDVFEATETTATVDSTSFDSTVETTADVTITDSSETTEAIEVSTAEETTTDETTAEESTTVHEHTVVVDKAKDATCTKTGLTEGSHCSVCGEILTAQSIVKTLGHSEVIDKAVAPTCTETGLTEGSHCSVCGDTLVAQDVVPKLDHDWQLIIDKNSTEDEEGVSHEECSVCHEKQNENTAIPKLEHTHNIEIINAKAPTCTQSGNNEYYHCTKCGQYYKEASASTLTNIVAETLSAKGHTFSQRNTSAQYLKSSATDTHSAEYYYSCIHCGAKGFETFYEDTQVKLYVDGRLSQTLIASADNNYHITLPEHPEDITTNPYLEKYFHGWFLDAGYNLPATEDTVFSKSTSIYAKWVDCYTSSFGYTVSTGKATITSCSASASTTILVVPCYINSFPVTAISNNVFKNRTQLRTLIICDGIETIGSAAFSGCNSMTYVRLPNTLTSIGNSAFLGCTLLTNITIPNSVTSIGSSAFQNCTGLTSVTIGNGVTSISNYAFSGCTGLTSIKIPDSVTSIGSSAFNGCTGLTSIKIPDSVTIIGDSAFSGCTGLTSIEIPDNVTSIGDYAFYKCTGLTSVTIGNGVESIGDETFYGCTGLASITIGNSVTSIGEDAFSGCYRLIEVYNRSALSIKVGTSDYGDVAYYAKNVYTADGGSKLHKTDDGYVFYEDGDTILLMLYQGNETAISLPTNYQGKNYAINQYAFRDCTRLTSVTIGNSVTSIGNYAFYGCTGLTSVTIGNSVTSIGERAFYNCTGLTSIVIPDSVTSIGYKVFYDCTGLTSITIPNSVTSIDYYAFYDCTGLTRIDFNGTKAQWYAMSKDSDWNNNTGSYTIHCTDGDIAKS